MFPRRDFLTSGPTGRCCDRLADVRQARGSRRSELHEQRSRLAAGGRGTADVQVRIGEDVGRLIDSREIAHLVAFLDSPLAAATNGAALRVEGGLRSIVQPVFPRQPNHGLLVPAMGTFLASRESAVPLIAPSR